MPAYMPDAVDQDTTTFMGGTQLPMGRLVLSNASRVSCQPSRTPSVAALTADSFYPLEEYWATGF